MSFISFIYEKHGSFFSRGDGLFDCYETCFVYIQNVDVALSRRGNRRRVSNRAVCASYAVHRHGRRTDGVVSKGCGSRRNRRHEASERITHGIRNYGVDGVFGYMRSVVRTRKQNFVFVLESKQFAAFFHHASHPYHVNAVRIPSQLVLGTQKIRCLFFDGTH